MDIVNAAETGLSRGVRFVLRANENLKGTDTYLFTDQVVLLSDVYWVFPKLNTTSWPTRYIPNKVYEYVDMNSDVRVPRQVNSNTSLVLFHADVPGDGGLVIPYERSYVKLAKIAHSRINIWITDERGHLATLPREKTRNMLHFRKKKKL